jgi:threonine dehydratase
MLLTELSENNSSSDRAAEGEYIEADVAPTFALPTPDTVPSSSTAPRLEDIRAARERIAGRVHRTPTVSATRLGERAGVGTQLFLKCESLQKTGSFKSRGALNALLQLDAGARTRGVVTVSAGNHAQAIAWAAAVAGVRATVVMPTVASSGKVAASRGYGAEVVLHGATGAEAFAKAHELAAQFGLVFVHPFDDPAVMAGAGTTALELLEDVDDLDVVIVGIGGGGLLGGMAVALRELRPDLRIYGVEPTGAAAMRQSLDAGRPVRLEATRTIADGLAAPMAGDATYPIIRDNVDDVVLVTDDQIAQGMRDLLIYAKLLAEPAGAAATAALLCGAIPVGPGDRVAAVVSGGNVDLSRLCELVALPPA